MASPWTGWGSPSASLAATGGAEGVEPGRSTFTVAAVGGISVATDAEVRCIIGGGEIPTTGAGEIGGTRAVLWSPNTDGPMPPPSAGCPTLPPCTGAAGGGGTTAAGGRPAASMRLTAAFPAIFPSTSSPPALAASGLARPPGATV